MHLREAIAATGSLNILLAAFGMAVQIFLLFKTPWYLMAFRVFLAAAVLSNGLYILGVFHFWEGQMAPWHSAIYIAAAMEASWWLVMGEHRLKERKRYREFGIGVGMFLAGAYLLVWRTTADADSTTSIFCTGFLLMNLLDVEETIWLLKTAFGNHATLMLAWFGVNMLATLFPHGWFTPNAWKLGVHTLACVIWLIVVGFLPAARPGGVRSGVGAHL